MYPMTSSPKGVQMLKNYFHSNLATKSTFVSSKGAVQKLISWLGYTEVDACVLLYGSYSMNHMAVFALD